MKISATINLLLHQVLVLYVRNRYFKRLKNIIHKNPQIKKTPDKEELKRHLKLWNSLLPGCSKVAFNVFANTSGVNDARFVPPDIFYCVIERCLNNCDAAGFGIEDKNDVCFYIPKKYQPKTYLRYVRGVYFDDNFNPITRNQAQEILQLLPGDVVGKPSSGSCGGSNVKCFRRNEQNQYISKNVTLTLDWIEATFEAYVLQERILQEEVTAKFNPASLNTCRMVTFRRPWSGEVSVIATMLRMGGSDDIVDNLTSGGISCDINTFGHLANYAVDKYFQKYSYHPVSGIIFEGMQIPFYNEMCKVVCDVAQHIPSYNLLSFDVVARPNGIPCVIEINATSMSLLPLQTCRPLFGDDTKAVVNWCLKNKKFDIFKHFRTWY